MVYFYWVDVKYNSEDYSTQGTNLRISGAIECSRIENIEQYTTIFNDLKNNLFTEYVKPLNDSASIEDCTFILTALNPL